MTINFTILKGLTCYLFLIFYPLIWIVQFHISQFLLDNCVQKKKYMIYIVYSLMEDGQPQNSLRAIYLSEWLRWPKKNACIILLILIPLILNNCYRWVLSWNLYISFYSWCTFKTSWRCSNYEEKEVGCRQE